MCNKYLFEEGYDSYNGIGPFIYAISDEEDI